MTTPRPASGSRPPGWQQEHARRYIETGGKDGHRDGDRYVVVASRGGAPAHPAWYENLTAQPEIHVQVMADRFKARARVASPTERPALWKKMAAIWPP
ncbi:MAG TPA: nitroreductase/quinone reductase family protein, partial [Candidatus Deferrimicrobiaceae bacterium]|nr:nitroreductase/quinone reductase family protein [Candidatus Deferrimicrobiaceae bacterium]